MIRIPIAENRVGPAAATDAKFQAADFSGTGLQALGHGLKQLGQAGQQFAKARQEQADRVQSLHDDGVMKYSYRTLADRSRDLLHAGPDALLNRVSGAAGDGQRTFVERILPLRKQLLDQIDDRGLADLTAGTLDARIRQDLDRVQAHAEAQTAVWQRQQSEGLQDSAAADALHAVGTPLFVDHVATGLRAIETQADIDNEPPEVRRAREAGYISGIHARVIDDQVMRDPVGAQAYAGIHHREIGDADRATIDLALHPALVEREGVAVVDGCVAATTGAAPQVGPIPAGPVDIADRMTAITLHRDAPSRAATPRDLAQDRPGQDGLGQDGAGQGDPAGRDTAPALAASPDPTAPPDPAAGGRSLVAMMDRYGGDPVKAWAAYRAGPDAVDAALAAQGDGWFAALPAAARSYVHTNVAMLGGGGDHTPQRGDLPALRASIAAQDLPAGVEQAALANADLRVARGERATRQRQDAATDAAYADADDLGAGFTSITQLPPAIRDDLPPPTIEALTRQAGQNAVPQPVAENGDAVAGLNLQLSRDPSAFAQQDLRLVRDLMTPREYATLSALQSQLRTDPAAPPVVAQRRILATIARDGPTLGIDLASPDPAIRQRAQALAAAMATDLAAETAGKRLPTDEEIARSFQRQSDLVVKADLHIYEDVKSLSNEQFAAIHAFAKAQGWDEAQENQAIHDFVHRRFVGGDQNSPAILSGYDRPATGNATSRLEGDELVIEANRQPKSPAGYDLNAFRQKPYILPMPKDGTSVSSGVTPTLRSWGQSYLAAFDQAYGPKSLYGRYIGQPFLRGLSAVSDSPLGDVGVGMSVEQAGAGINPLGALPGAVLVTGQRGIRAVGQVARTAFRTGADIPVAGSVRTVNLRFPAPGFTENCVECAIATERRFAGMLGTSAKPTAGPLPIARISDQFGGSFQRVSGPMEIGKILAQAGEGSRGIVYGRASGKRIGHVWNVRIDKDEVRFLDSQPGNRAGLGISNFEKFTDFQFILTQSGKPS